MTTAPFTAACRQLCPHPVPSCYRKRPSYSRYACLLIADGQKHKSKSVDGSSQHVIGLYLHGAGGIVCGIRNIIQKAAYDATRVVFVKLQRTMSQCDVDR